MDFCTYSHTFLSSSPSANTCNAYKTPKSWKAVGEKTIKQLGEATVKAIITKLNAKAELTGEDREFLRQAAK